jgi:hypothetical protein
VEGGLAGCCGRVALFCSMWVERGRGLSSNNMGIGVGVYPAAMEGSYVGCSVCVAPFRMLVERGGVFLMVGGLLCPIPWLYGRDRAVGGALTGCCGRVALFRSMWVERGRGLSSNNMGIGVGVYPAAMEGSYVGCSVRVAPFRMLVERGGVFLMVGGLLCPIPWLYGRDRAVEGALTGCCSRVLVLLWCHQHAGGYALNHAIYLGGWPVPLRLLEGIPVVR